jgi:hypothetical protein
VRIVPGDKARVEIDGEAILVTIGGRLDPETAAELGSDGHHVTYEQGDKEGTVGRHRQGELKPV